MNTVTFEEVQLYSKKPEPPLKDKETQEKKKSHGTYMRLNAYDRHVKFINDYVLRFGKSAPPLNTEHHRTDHDVLKNNYKFIREGSEDTSNWEVRMALKYYNKLFREYCLADMSRYKDAKVGLRWRTQQEVFVNCLYWQAAGPCQKKCSLVVEVGSLSDIWYAAGW